MVPRTWPAQAGSGGEGPGLVGTPGARPDLHLGAGRGGPAGVVQALPGLRVQECAVTLRHPDLGAGAVAVVEVHGGAVGCARRVHVQALTERLQRVTAGDRPLLRTGAVAGVDLHRGEVGRAGAAHVQAQAAVAGDRPGRAGAPAASAARTAAGDLVEDLRVRVADRLVVAVDFPEGQLLDAVGRREALQRGRVGLGEVLVVVVLPGDRGQAHPGVRRAGADPVQAGQL